MAELTVYEKRSCTTCRKLAMLLEERGSEIRQLVRKTGRPARELFRAREPVHRELGLGDREVDDNELARPVERVLELLDGSA